MTNFINSAAFQIISHNFWDYQWIENLNTKKPLSWPIFMPSICVSADIITLRSLVITGVVPSPSLGLISNTSDIATFLNTPATISTTNYCFSYGLWPGSNKNTQIDPNTMITIGDAVDIHINNLSINSTPNNIRVPANTCFACNIRFHTDITTDPSIKQFISQLGAPYIPRGPITYSNNSDPANPRFVRPSFRFCVGNTDITDLTQLGIQVFHGELGYYSNLTLQDYAIDSPEADQLRIEIPSFVVPTIQTLTTSNAMISNTSSGANT